MKLPSLHYLSAQAKNSFLRFPLTIISSLIAVVLAIYLVEEGKDIKNIFPLINLMLCLSIGIPLYFCVTIIATKYVFSQKNIIYFNLFATLILVAIYFTLPTAESTHNISLPYVKYGLYNITCHLLVAIAPFALSKQLNGFWNYNKALFLRILLSAVYSFFIYVGLILALTALKLLFDVNIHEKLYVEIWIATIGFFNTWFFVSGIPTDFDHLEEINDYPKGLRIFSQYVLLPLLGLYLLILYAYGAKIIITSNWPKGIVGYLIIFVSILGIFTFLLLHPYGNLKESSWVKKVSRGYYFSLMPLLVLLYIAIFMRINDYGITINRYAILILALWITIVCLYSAFGKTNIKFIPTSLAIILILISFGPWGIFSVSERSQVNRLRTNLEQAKILINGKIQNETIWEKDSLPKLYTIKENANQRKIKDTVNNDVISIISYLDDHHGFSSIQTWYKQNLNAIVDSQQKSNIGENYFNADEPNIYIKSMGLENQIISLRNNVLYNDYNFKEEQGFTTITGYDYLIDFNGSNSNHNDLEIKKFKIENTPFTFSFSDANKNILLLKSDNDLFKFHLDDYIKKLKSQYGSGYNSDIPISSMTIIASNASFEIKLQFNSINTESTKDRDFITYLQGKIFIKKK